MTKQLLYMGRPPDDEEARLEWVLEVYRRITGKEPTPEDIEATRRTLGLPPAPSMDRSDVQ